ncbi:cadherin domain-containing protein [Sphingosinicella sp. CPCC 101087]|uniref:cadherin domain-containing protein n=1 Tax=Sphingosinicella sp. CPCC 101087 TaxID=2497754 RepID=UPI0013E9B61B|nr:cadherin domain-containing protein [Sphingosinicella sp. CPCC 101087]
MVELDVAEVNGAPTVVRSRASDGWSRNGPGLTVETIYSNNEPVSTNIKLNNNPVRVEFSDAGSILGQQLGYLLADGNELAGIVTSAALQTIGDNLGDALDGLVGDQSIDAASKDAFATFGPEFLNNLKAAGIGAVSSYLTAQLVNALGMDGFAGELVNTAAGTVINTVLSNIAAGSSAFQGLSPASIGTAIGSFLGNKLANEVISFDTIGGQIGSAVGSTLAVLAVSVAFGPPGLIAAAAAAFIGNIVGGLIGSVFGGTPRSGADVAWDSATGEFTVANAYSRKGGSKDAAQSMASAVAQTFNGIIAATGGRLMEPGAVQSGNYGMRKKDYVYRPFSTRDKDEITIRFSGEDGAERLIGYGIYQGLTDSDFKIAGGDIYVKRAIYNTFALGGFDPIDFDTSIVLGNIATAQRYETYLASSTTINALIAAEPDSVFTAEWAITFSRAVELGLTRRHESDWYGGFSLLLREAQTNAANVALAFDHDPFGEKISRAIGVGDFILGDSIDIAGQATIEGTSGSNIIRLSGTQLLATSGSTNAGLTIDGAAHNSQARDIDVAATIDAGAGDDTVHASDRGDNVFGGAGNDSLYGGRLDDWLLGGDDNDILHAGSQAGGLGGDGNYLDGGAGNDQVHGREGSDWLEGGGGQDTLIGAAGDDILAGGAGNGDDMWGGAGNDQYLFRRGDGDDLAEDEAEVSAGGSGGASDPLRARLAGIAAGTIARDWLGERFGASAPPPQSGASTPVNAGEDKLVLGQGITLNDIRLVRGGQLAGTTDNDLILELTTIVDGQEVWSGDRLLMKDWYNSYKRVEWLVFADGQEIRIGDFQTFIAGSNGNDTIIGTQGRDFAVGGPGDDWMSLLGGDDVGIGGTGKDWVSGDGDADLLVGGDDDDHVLGGWGDDTMSGDAGNDELDGGHGRDVVAGGLGRDLVVGGAGDDIFRFNRGDGTDTLLDDFAGEWQVVMARELNPADPKFGALVYRNDFDRDEDNRVVRIVDGVADIVFDGTNWVGRVQFDVSTQQLRRLVRLEDDPLGQDATQTFEMGDTLEFGWGINIQDVMLTQYGWDLVVGISSENANTTNFETLSDRIVLADWYRHDNRPIEKFVFSAVGMIDVEATQLVGGTNDSDTLEGTSAAEWITGNGGDDTITGAGSDDVLNGNAGSDILSGGSGTDVLYGGAGNDVLEGGAGADILVGGDGSDTASYASAGGTVGVYLSSSEFNSGDAAGDTFHSIENLTGSSHNDHALGGDDGDNVIAGGAGNDNLFGGAGDDTYVWNALDFADTIDDRPFVLEEAVSADGKLNSTYIVSWTATSEPQPSGGVYWRLHITDSAGDDVYDHLYSVSGSSPPIPMPSGYIQDGWAEGIRRVPSEGGNITHRVVRQRFDAADGGEDTLELGPGISLTDLSFVWEGPDLIIRYANNEHNSVRIKGQSSANSAVEWLQLNDGLAVSLKGLKIGPEGGELYGTAGNDFLIARASAEGVAAVLGGAGDDVIVGAAGMSGSYGEDGDDVIEAGLGLNIIDGGANGAAGDTVRFVRFTAVTVDLRPTDDGYQMAQHDGIFSAMMGIENIVGTLTGADSIIGNDEGNRLIGLGGNDNLTGLGGDDVLAGDGGDDILQAGDGDDNLSGGDGLDQMWGGVGKDLLDGGVGNDVLKGDGGNDTLVGGSGNDDLEGGAGNDVLMGGAGTDTLKAGDGDDQLTGDVGNDRLEGGVGNDAYSFGARTGEDLVIDAAGANDIMFDPSVDLQQVWMTKVNSDQDLRIAVIGGSSVITVRDFFATGSGRTLMRSIKTGTHAIFIDHPDVRALIDAMTAASAAVTPTEMPSAIRDMLSTYWHEGGTAAPKAATISLTTDEDTPLIVSDLGVIDHDRNIVEYSISVQPAHGTISGLDTATGTFTYTPAAQFDGSDSFKLIVRDADGHSAEVPVKIQVRGTNDAPGSFGIEGGGPLSVVEFALGSPTVSQTVVGRLTAVDPEGQFVWWSLVDGADGRFGVTDDGVLFVDDPDDLDYSVDRSHQVTVRASDVVNGFHYRDHTYTVYVENVNEAPHTPVLLEARGIVSEYYADVGFEGTSDFAGTPSLANTWIARFSLSDPDGTTPELRLVGNPGNRFKIVGNEIRFADDYQPNYETLYQAHHTPGSDIALEDSDGDGYREAVLTASVQAFDGELASPGSATVQIRIEDTNERPISLDWAPIVTSILEQDRVLRNTDLPPIELGDVSVTDPDIWGYLHSTYAFEVVNDQRFYIVGNTLFLSRNAAVDFEDGGAVSVSIVATDLRNRFSVTDEVTIVLDDRVDVLQGDADNTATDDVLVGQQNEDLLYGYGGSDVLDGGAGHDHLEGGWGDDRVIGGEGDDDLYGEDGNDLLVGGAGSDSLHGGSNDVGAKDVLLGGDGDDLLDGGNGDDDLAGGAGADELIGGSGIDRASYAWLTEGMADAGGVTADLANPSENTGAAAGDAYYDIEGLVGSAGADILRGDDSANQIEGGNGDDLVEGREGNDSLAGGDGNDALVGSDGSDSLAGGAGNDILHGGEGHDTLLGGDGNDELYADSGDDTLHGGAGDDILNGGVDSDTYIMNRESGADVIFNYDPFGEDVDVLGLSAVDGQDPIQDRELWFEKIENDMKISLIGTSSSVLIKDWYVLADADTRANYKLDYIIAEQRYTKTIDTDGLVALMCAQSKPDNLTELSDLMADPTYHAAWDAYWHPNLRPEISSIANQVMNEDGTLTLTLNVGDDVTPAAGIQISKVILSGSSVIDADDNVSIGPDDGNGNRTVTITPRSNAAGTARIQLLATDAGGSSTPTEFTVTVNPVPDTPTIAHFSVAGGTSGVPGGLAISINVNFPDPDGETQQVWISGIPSVATLSAGTPDGGGSWRTWKVSANQLANLKLYLPAGWHQDLTLTATARASEGGQTAISASRSAPVIVNAPPTGATLSGSVNENVANETVVGTVTGIDPDGTGGLQYTLTNNAGGRFWLHATTGRLVAADGGLLDHELASSHPITVLVTDSFGKSKSVTFSVPVNDVNEDNWLPGTYGFNVNENVAVGTVIGTITAGDHDSGSVNFGRQAYMFDNGSERSLISADGRYKINKLTGVITTNAASNHEVTGPTRTYTVLARDNANTSGLNYDGYNQVSTQVTIGINNLNEANSVPGSYSFGVNENVSIGTVVGTVAAADLDHSTSAYGQQRYYFDNGTARSATSADGRYKIDPVTGVIRTNSGLNREAASPTKTYTVVVRDNKGQTGYNQVSTQVTISIGDVNEPNSWQTINPLGVNENVAVGTVVGSVTAGDQDIGSVNFGRQAYMFDNGSERSQVSADGRYKINRLTGVITTNSGLNFEAGSASRTYTVLARDNANTAGSNQPGYHQIAAQLSIAIRNVNEAPTMANQTFSRSEQPANPTAKLVPLAWNDVDGKPVNGHRFSIVGGDPDGFWSIDNAGNISAVRTLNYEDSAHRTFNLRVRVTDQSGSGLSAESTITINLTNVNEAPNPTASGNVYPGAALANSLVGMIQHRDPDAGDVISYQILSVTHLDHTSGGSVNDYRVVANGQYASVYTNITRGGSWQYRESIEVRVTDAAGTSRTTSFIVTYNGDKHFAPIVLDLDGDGLELVSRIDSEIHFDMDGDGVLDRTGWAAADDAFLALDRDGDGLITHSDELTFIDDVEGAVSDLEGLRAFDTDQDGFIDADDDAYGTFRVWQDLSQDGVSQTDELRTLSQAGIAFVNLMLTPTGADMSNVADNIIYATGEYILADGTRRQLGDVMLSYEPSTPDIAPPIILDLDGDGVTTTELAENPVMFDMDGDGKTDRTGWVGGNDGLLALDRNGDGKIEGISEISYVDDLPGARTDLEGLVAFDTNKDGKLSAADSKFGDFRVWADANHDGVSDDGELKRLAEIGIVSLNLEGDPTGNPTVPGKNVIYNLSSFLRGDGTTGIVGDVGLAYFGSEGGETDVTGTSAIVPETSLFSGKRKHYAIETSRGAIFLNYSRARGLTDAGVGEIANSAALEFRDGSMGFGSALVLDLDGDGLELKRRKKTKAAFDLNADGVADDTGWVKKQDGLLVLDRNGNGLIDGAGEISFLADLAGARTSLEGLTAFDTNRNGLVDAEDEQFGKLQVWQDLNGDGRSSADELKSLEQAKIESIGLRATPVDRTWKRGRNVVVNTTSFTRTDGSGGTVGDVAFAYKAAPAPLAPAAESAIDLDDRLRALRAALDPSATGFALRPEMIEAFEFLNADATPLSDTPGQSDMSSSAALAGLGEAAEADELLDRYENRLAYAVQQMAGFGSRSGEAESRDRAGMPTRYEFFAS